MRIEKIKFNWWYVLNISFTMLILFLGASCLLFADYATHKLLLPDNNMGALLTFIGSLLMACGLITLLTRGNLPSDAMYKREVFLDKSELDVYHDTGQKIIVAHAELAETHPTALSKIRSLKEFRTVEYFDRKECLLFRTFSL